LQLNANKTNLVHFKLQNSENVLDTIEFNNEQIKFVNEAKMLGVNIDKLLRWDIHISDVCKKLSRALFAMRILKKCVHSDILLHVYFAYFHSILSYGIEIWGHAPLSVIDRVFILQKRAIRLLCNLSYTDSCRDYFKTLKILPTPALYIAQTLIFIKKNPHYFEKSKQTHIYNTRNKDLFLPDIHRTSKYEMNLRYSALKFHNHLPKTLRDEKSVLKFKSQIKYFLLNNNVYSIQNFLAINV